MSGLFGSSVTQPSEYDPPSSKTGFQLMPRFCVFQSPLEAVETYHTFRLRGSTTMSDTRPGVDAGPMLRSDKPSAPPVVSACVADESAAGASASPAIARSPTISPKSESGVKARVMG